MRHHKKQRSFGKVGGGRKPLLRSLAISLITHGKMTTTDARAKELRTFVEPLITQAKKGTLGARRIVSARLSQNKAVTKKLFDTLAPQYKERRGGYTRISKLGFGKGDARAQVIIELV